MDWLIDRLTEWNNFLADEKQKLDPYEFRQKIIETLNAAGNNLDEVSSQLDQKGSQDYRTYADSLIHILLTGGLLGKDNDPLK
jgi:hypothetical protein